MVVAPCFAHIFSRSTLPLSFCCLLYCTHEGLHITDIHSCAPHMYAVNRAHPNGKPEIHLIEKDIQSAARRWRRVHFSVCVCSTIFECGCWWHSCIWMDSVSTGLVEYSSNSWNRAQVKRRIINRMCIVRGTTTFDIILDSRVWDHFTCGVRRATQYTDSRWFTFKWSMNAINRKRINRTHREIESVNWISWQSFVTSFFVALLCNCSKTQRKSSSYLRGTREIEKQTMQSSFENLVDSQKN